MKKTKSNQFKGKTTLLWAIMAILALGIIATIFAVNETGLVTLKTANKNVQAATQKSVVAKKVSTTTSTSNTGTVYINVNDEEGKPIPKANLLLLNCNIVRAICSSISQNPELIEKNYEQIKNYAITKFIEIGNGSYKFEKIPFGNYTIIATKKDYSPNKTSIELTIKKRTIVTKMQLILKKSIGYGYKYAFEKRIQFFGINENHVFLVHPDGELAVYNISNKSFAKIASDNVFNYVNYKQPLITNFAYKKNIIFVTIIDKRHSEASKLLEFEFSNTRIEKKFEYQNSGEYLAITENFLYTGYNNYASGTAYLLIFNIKEPTKPIFIKKKHVEDYINISFPNQFFQDKVYSITPQGSISILDIGDKTDPKHIGAYSNIGFEYGSNRSFVLKEKYLIAALGNLKIKIFDISDITKIKEVASINEQAGSAKTVNLVENTLFATFANTNFINLYQYDVSNPINPQLQRVTTLVDNIHTSDFKKGEYGTYGFYPPFQSIFSENTIFFSLNETEEENSQDFGIKEKLISLKLTKNNIDNFDTCEKYGGEICTKRRCHSNTFYITQDPVFCCTSECDSQTTINLYSKKESVFSSIEDGEPITEEYVDLSIHVYNNEVGFPINGIEVFLQAENGKIIKINPSIDSYIPGQDQTFRVYNAKIDLVDDEALLISEFIKISISVIDLKGKRYTKSVILNLLNLNNFPCKKIVDNGSNDKKINLFLISDGFSDISKFEANLLAHLSYNEENKQGIFAVEPFKSNKASFNIFKVSTTKKFGCNSIINDQFTIGCSQAFIRGLIQKFCGIGKSDIIIMITDVGGLRVGWASLGFATTAPKAYTTTTHEFGHAFGFLGDEYWLWDYVTRLDYAGRLNQDMEGCPKWCSGKVDKTKACYSLYQNWKKCSEPYISNPAQHGNELTDCWNNATSDTNPLEDCELGTKCMEETKCYFTSSGPAVFRHIGNGIMNMLSTTLPVEYRYGIISEEAMQKLIDEKTNPQTSAISAKKIELPKDKIIWYDNFDEKGKIVSGGEINLTKMETAKKAKLIAKTMELSKTINPEEKEKYEILVSKALATTPIMAKKIGSQLEMEKIESIIDLETKEVKIENLNPSTIIEAYTQLN